MVAFGAVLVAAIILIVQRYYFHEKLSDYTLVNEGVVLTKEFSVKSHVANQNTSAKGSVFVWGDKGIAERMRIVVSYEIDPKDFGGMTIYIPKKWYISNIVSSQPENQKTSLQPYASKGDKSLGDEWRNEIVVGVDYLGKPSGGGTGTILIDLVSDRQAILPLEIFNIMVAIGSNTQNGVRSIGVDYVKIPISIDAES